MLASGHQEGQKEVTLSSSWLENCETLYSQRQNISAEGFFIPMIPFRLGGVLGGGGGETQC